MPLGVEVEEDTGELSWGVDDQQACEGVNEGVVAALLPVLQFGAILQHLKYEGAAAACVALLLPLSVVGGCVHLAQSFALHAAAVL